MNRPSNGAPDFLLRFFYIGSGAATGVALGMIVGLLLFQDFGIGASFGAALGLVIGAVVEFKSAG